MRRSAGAHGPQGAGRIALVAFVLSFVAMAIWSVAMPLLSGPDEPTHVVKSVGFVRGQFVGNCIDVPPLPGQHVAPPCPDSGPDGATTEIVDIPAFYALLRPAGDDATQVPGRGIECEAHRPTQPASCSLLPTPYRSGEEVGGKFFPYNVKARIYDGRYPPEYYAVVGLPTLLGQGTWVLYLMRLLSAALCSLFVALAVLSVLCWSTRRLLLFGIVIAASPMVLYLGGVINPTGLEIAASIPLWTAGLILVLERREAPPAGLVATFSASAVVMVLARSLSPLWLALCLLTLGALCGPSGLRSLARARSIRRGGAAVLVATAVALSWTIYEHATNVRPGPTPPAGTSLWTIARTALHYDVHWLPNLIGIFGSFDTYAPPTTYLLWYALIALVLGVALWFGSGRERLLLVLVLAAIVLLPPAIVVSHARVDGYLWNGRDTLPLAVGLPLLAAAVAGRERASWRSSPWTGRLGALVVGALAVAQFGALYEALRRYSVGTAGALFGFVLHHSWAPPGGIVPPLAAEVVLLVVVGALLRRAWRQAPLPPPPSGSLPTSAAAPEGGEPVASPLVHADS